MYCELITLEPRPGQLGSLLSRLEATVTGPELLGCWTTVLGHAPRVFVLRRTVTTVRAELVEALGAPNPSTSSRRTGWSADSTPSTVRAEPVEALGAIDPSTSSGRTGWSANSAHTTVRAEPVEALGAPDPKAGSGQTGWNAGSAATNPYRVLGITDLVRKISFDTYATLPCLPDVVTGAFGHVYEFRIYELQPHGALNAALAGWAEVIQTRLALAPITAVMHSVTGQVPRLVHIYPYRDLHHRLQIREQAMATGVWPPKGGSSRNQVMAAEMAVSARFSPLH